ncbi:bifunctional tetrahydrofolate synthase/dihydrofolate synthase [Methylophilus sp.]|uniref:bifunctional tetrahydrofolate synthase/dihydrofolate synthase n=1 Tax=Methylophilus sp. TaxID=29541 RepID=UPI000D43FF20|nr:bifunctional tetrahydrofolate synthase/dihydrofolate synthase [Methylophilus sp.]PPD12419.1 MAG: bifunctional tetrahydrofolate synthase/dihydrofolate synthase [Methylophilus sp.]
MPPVIPELPKTVEDWLGYIESLHPKSIEMGLGRVQTVANRLQLKFPFTVITVGGTNGKGSTCAMLERIYTLSGYRVGCYTSPHLLHYQERVRFNGEEIADGQLCEAFAAVEQARADITLTYFEMGTLAALWAFEQAPLDVVVLEVGLGGRLDAVNIVDADCAIVTNVDLDHMEFLGDTRELIGREKAGIYRQQQIAICGDANPPASLLLYASSLGVTLNRFGIDYQIDVSDTQKAHYRDAHGQLDIGSLSLFGRYQWNNAANVMFAVRSLHDRLPVAEAQLLQALTGTEVTGRFQYWHRSPDVILDVAHNPHAARALRDNLQRLSVEGGKVIAVFSMLSDKDIASVVDILHDVIDEWHVAPIQHPRAASIDFLQACLTPYVSPQHIYPYADLAAALQSAYKKAAKNDKIIVFGSFFTVAAILELTPDQWAL